MANEEYYVEILNESRKIVFTGGIYAHSSGARISRKQVAEMVADLGKIPVDDASKADMLVLGDIRGSSTRKLDIAEANGIPIMSSRDFIEAYHTIVQ